MNVITRRSTISEQQTARAEVAPKKKVGGAKKKAPAKKVGGSKKKK